MKRLTLYIFILAGCALFLIPFLWTVSTSLKTKQAAFASPPQWLPRSFALRPDPAGGADPDQLIPVNRTLQIDVPAAVVKIENGLRAGQVMAVQRSQLQQRDGAFWLKLKNPQPVRVSIQRDMPSGVAQVKLSDPANPQRTLDRFVAPDELIQQLDPQWSNYARAWWALPVPFHHFVLNTYTITILNILGQTLSCSLVAYGFARFRFRGRKALFLLLLSTLMLPAQVTMIPVYLIWDRVQLIDTFAPLAIPAFFAQNAFFVFLLRQFFLGIPRELDEAAMIDGAGPLRIWWQVLLPLSKPAITTVAVLSFIAHWDDFVGPLIYLNNLENYTVSIALRMFQNQEGSEFNLLMAAALVHIVPVLILFFLAQRYFVKGIAMTGMKS